MSIVSFKGKIRVGKDTQIVEARLTASNPNTPIDFVGSGFSTSLNHKKYQVWLWDNFPNWTNMATFFESEPCILGFGKITWAWWKPCDTLTCSLPYRRRLSGHKNLT